MPFKKARLAALGTGSSYRTFFIAKLGALAVDPHPLVPRFADTATLRIYRTNEATDLTLIQDVREKSIIGGLAAMGGLWTALNAIHAFLFGGSILLRQSVLKKSNVNVNALAIRQGRKPLTLFGLVDEIARRRLRDGWRKKYPGLAAEREHKGGFAALLQAHLVDIDILYGLEDEDATDDDSHGNHVPANSIEPEGSVGLQEIGRTRPPAPEV